MERGGAKGDRTPDLLNAIQALSQLSYGPTFGADYETRTRDLHLGKVALYQLS
jgi:hypothetical protein